MATPERLVPYVRQLLDNGDVHDDLERSVLRAREAYVRARGRKSAKQAVKDQRVRARARQSVIAARDAVVTLRNAPEQEQRGRRRRRLLLSGAVLGSGGLLLLSQPARVQFARRLRAVAGTSAEPSRDGSVNGAPTEPTAAAVEQ
jgi:hypothetical protein